MGMRWLALLALTACGGSSRPPTAVTNSTAARVAADPYAHATLVVRGRLHVDLDVPVLDVDRIYKGGCTAGLLLDPENLPKDTHGQSIDGIYLLAKASEPDRWHVIAADPPTLALPSTREPEVITALASITAPEPSPTYAPDFATFRSMYGQPWSPAQMPAMEAGVRIFDHVAFIGMKPDAVERLLGKPDSIEDDSWNYTRHMGEVGVVRRFGLKYGRVVTIDIIRTQ